ncbi:MAG: DNA-directed RNA polymerase subunit D [Candidatus Pacearchaeota archaeon]
MKNQSKLKIVLETNESLINAIRRSVNEIPIIAIEEVEFHKNDSALYDEILAHRLGLIPLEEKRKIEELNNNEKPTTKNQIQISLNLSGPKIVYSGDLKGEAKAIYEKMPIVILEKEQELKLVAFARLGKGINHAKYSPGLMYYRNVLEIKIKNPDKAHKIIEEIKTNFVTSPKLPLKSGDIYISTDDFDYVNNMIEDNEIELSNGKSIVLFIESWGQKTAKDIFSESVQIFKENLKELIKLIEK